MNACELCVLQTLGYATLPHLIIHLVRFSGKTHTHTHTMFSDLVHPIRETNQILHPTRCVQTHKHHTAVALQLITSDQVRQYISLSLSIGLL